MPAADNGLLIDIAVPAAVLFEVKDRFPEKLEAPVVEIVPPFVRVKLCTLVMVPRVNAAEFPESFRIRLLLGPAAKLPESD